MIPRPEDYDPQAASVIDDPYPFYAVLRREAPVHRIAGCGFFAVSRHADVRCVLRDTTRFSSAAMRAAVLGAVRPGDAAEGASDEPRAVSIIGADGPSHTRLRNVVNRGFTPRRIAALEPRIREIAEGLLGPILSASACDFVATYTAPLPVMVIAELVGVDPERRSVFRRWADAMMLQVFGQPDDAELREIDASSAQMGEYMDDMIEERQRRPRDDLMSVLLAAGEGGALTHAEARIFLYTLLVAGSVTTAHLLGSALAALVRFPGELAKVQREPALIPSLVEESLRFESPAQYMLRTATGDTVLAGVRIPKDAVVTPLFGSANRDERVFAEPERFDVTRNPKDHLAFGNGVHFCLGAALARLEASIAFEVLLPRIRELELIEPVRWVRQLTLRGPESLRLQYVPVDGGV